jgi:flagellar motor switch protein FliM
MSYNLRLYRAVASMIFFRTLTGLRGKTEADADAGVLEALNHNLTRDGRQSLESIAALSVSLGTTSVDQAKYEQSTRLVATNTLMLVPFT